MSAEYQLLVNVKEEAAADDGAYHDSHSAEGCSVVKPRQERHAAILWTIGALLLVNVLAWTFAGARIWAICRTVAANLDNQETRSLPRPDTGNGL